MRPQKTNACVLGIQRRAWCPSRFAPFRVKSSQSCVRVQQLCGAWQWIYSTTKCHGSRAVSNPAVFTVSWRKSRKTFRAPPLDAQNPEQRGLWSSELALTVPKYRYAGDSNELSPGFIRCHFIRSRVVQQSWLRRSNSSKRILVKVEYILIPEVKTGFHLVVTEEGTGVLYSRTPRMADGRVVGHVDDGSQVASGIRAVSYFLPGFRWVLH